MPALSLNRIYTTQGEPAPTTTQHQWHHEEIGSERAWGITTGAGVVVAVIDTGIDLSHPDFTGRISIKSYNSHTDQEGIDYVQDDYGHGTHVSGIIAAAKNGDSDNSGVAPTAEILAIKANNPAAGYFDSASLYRAINYAAENGADIINMSLGRSYYSGIDQLEQEIIAAAVAKGVTVICSAGNSSQGNAGYPAAYPEAITVSATKQGYAFDRGYSNYGPEIDIAAPGTDIYSTNLGGGQTFMTGTSMASPNVAGVAALIKSNNPEYTPQQVRETLCGSARDAGIIGRDDYYGYGIVNAYAAALGVDQLHAVTYDFRYSEQVPITVRVAPGDILLRPDSPLRDGNIFAGWYMDPDYTSMYDFSKAVTGNIALYAKWVAAQSGMYFTEFPDTNFRREVVRLLDEWGGGNRWDGDFISDEDRGFLSSFELLDVSYMEIRDLTGIAYFTGLSGKLDSLEIASGNYWVTWVATVGLKCYGNLLETLDLSKNTELRVLDCSMNRLTELDVSKNTALELLICDWNQIERLDVTGASSLKYLNIDGNRLTEIDLSGHTKLEFLSCRDNYLSKLDISECSSLRGLRCAYNRLTALDVSKSPLLISLWCHNNQLERLDFSANTMLKHLNTGRNRLKALGISNNAALQNLGCYYNLLTELELNSEAPYTYIDVQYNFLPDESAVTGRNIAWDGYYFAFSPQYSGVPPTGRDITAEFTDQNFRAVVYEHIGKAAHEPILDTDVVWVHYLWAYNRGIKNLDGLEYFIGLSTLSADYNQLTSLPVIPANLSGLYVSSNQLTELPELPISLRWLEVGYNQLTKLPELPPSLESMYCYENQLTLLPSLPPNLTYLLAANNQLTSLPELPENLAELGVGGNQLATLPGMPPNLNTLSCWGNRLTGTLDVSYLHSLETLICNDNRLTGLALSDSAPYSYIYTTNNNMVDTSAITGRTIYWDIDPYFVFSPQNLTGDDSMCSHVWNAGVVTTEATVGREGVKTFTCTRPDCGVTRTESIPALKDPGSGPEPGPPPRQQPPQPTPAPTPPPTQILPVVVPQAPFTNPFDDVASGAWYHSNVMHVYREGLMTGTSATQFSPNVPTTRGMIVTILYRLSKSPAVIGMPNPFRDVAEGTWYTDAVKWAAANGIVSGLGEGRFGPTEDVTREQLATILSNYANFAKIYLSATGEYPGFADEKDIASYAKASVERLAKAGIVGGKPGNNFDPRGNATRAEVASMLTRLTTAK